MTPPRTATASIRSESRSTAPTTRARSSGTSTTSASRSAGTSAKASRRRESTSSRRGTNSVRTLGACPEELPAPPRRISRGTVRRRRECRLHKDQDLVRERLGREEGPVSDPVENFNDGYRPSGDGSSASVDSVRIPSMGVARSIRPSAKEQQIICREGNPERQLRTNSKN